MAWEWWLLIGASARAGAQCKGGVGWGVERLAVTTRVQRREAVEAVRSIGAAALMHRQGGGFLLRCKR